MRNNLGLSAKKNFSQQFRGDSSPEVLPLNTPLKRRQINQLLKSGVESHNNLAQAYVTFLDEVGK